MKSIKTIMIALALIVSVNVFAKNEKAVIKTSAQCEMCIEKIETVLKQTEGVKKFLLNAETNELIVRFDDEVTTLDKIETAISNTGYWANDKAPNREAYDALDDCCKPKAMATKACCASGAKTCSKDGAADGKKACCSSHSGDKKECPHGAGKEGVQPVKKSSCGHIH